jgi:hypothetical protein
MSIKNKKDMVLPNLYVFFKQPDNISKMLPIIMGESKISIRILDWFVTNYSKTKKIYYKINKDTFNVHINYSNQLDAYTKKLFDPFCRSKRIPFYYTETDYIITTVAQLNFFKWAISNKIIEYVENHFKEIYKDMQKKKEMIESEVLTTNDTNILLTKTDTPTSSIIKLDRPKIVYSNEKIEINFDV